MSPTDFAVAAAEFPNDNPLLHRGARWVCRSTRGAARAVLRAAAGEPSHVLISADRAPSAETRTECAPCALVLEPRLSAILRFEGPLQLDIDRLVIAHRVERVPPPPDFVFTPFVPAPLRAPSDVTAPHAARDTAAIGDKAACDGSPDSAHAAHAVAIEPRPCQVVDERDARQRVRRNVRVDIAPCLSVDAAPAPAPAAVANESAPPAPAVVGARRGRRRPTSSRVLVASPLPEPTELQRAIVELEAAFAKSALHSKLDEGAQLIPCRAGGA